MNVAALALAAIVLQEPRSGQAAGLRTVPIAGESIGDARQPSVALSPDGSVYVACVASDRVVVFVRPRGTKEFAGPSTVAVDPNVACGMRRGPRIVATNDAL